MSSETETSHPPELQKLAEANNFLAINLHLLLAEEHGNIFFSPFSISTAMAMLLCGSKGTTEAEMRSALGHEHAGIKKENIAQIFQKQMSILEKSPEFYTLACANSMLSQKDFSVKEEYKLILRESFKALLLEVNFQTDIVNVIDHVNNWVKQNTKNMIPKLINSLDPSTVLILLNAVYFKGNWLHKFNMENTRPRKFFNKGLENNGKCIDMMHITDYFPFVERETFKALQLPYAGKEVAMLVLLPHARDGLVSLESSLSPLLMKNLCKDMRKQKVEVTFPRFRLEYSKSLVPSFKRLGIEKAFSGSAELDILKEPSDIAVSEIFHKAVLVVNEEGSEAAAATMIAVGFCAPAIRSPQFVADHPFVFTIFDTRSSLIIFMGRVEEL